MNRIEFRDLISLEKAKKKLFSQFDRNKELKDIQECSNLKLAEDIYTKVDVPPFDRAAKDGYAVKASDTFSAREDNPISLKKKGEIFPGDNKNISVHNGEAVEVATGAVMPDGANAVVMIEYIDEEDNNEGIKVRKSVAPADNIMYAGSDMMAGEKVLSKDKKLNPRDIGVLGAIGRKEVEVYSKPKVGVLSIGEELRNPGDKIKDGQIFDTNSYSIQSAIIEAGGKPRFYGIVGDDREKIEEKIKRGISECDLLLTSGSTSAGSSDLLHDVLKEGEIIFHGVAVKPGKPTICAKLEDKIVIGLPGYPTSALTIFNLLIAPLIHQLIGKKTETNKIKAETAVKVRSTSGRRHFHPVGLVKRNNKFLVYPIEKGSGAISSLSQAEGVIEIPEEENYIQAGAKKEVQLFSKNIDLPDILIIGSHCIGIDLIRKMLNGSVKSIHVGSRGGFRMISKNIADVAGAHYISEEGEYNLPLLKKNKMTDTILIKGYLREQGILVEKGNPKNIKNLRDLINKDVRLINRNKGSGTRRYLDLKLQKIANKDKKDIEEIKKEIKGYNTSSKTHSGVGSAVKLGKADAGIGIKYFAEKNNLDFIKLDTEEYDFLINKNSYSKTIVKTLIKKIRTEKFKNKLSEYSGIKAYEKTGKQIQI
ncbi:MAG: Molybdopterin molybdenumtransferase fused to periplasmic molybdate-binding domain [Candidatus Methanohalarchaeum thermophilum]|uniref:Molybdopterin molybdenumtransferase fused to periplasmic molybdate-binding domain n=1 Tax=Methanohalarchaeum thermophilum TaxID=1903181 RepID=A0A1Q6DW86_METT1|nr:MAG: Molybdopterin molybdenumtransferase fused to periplasmic molybdate-binding domain [Candidatus Methanohalarchaeum thermophilum]